MNRKRKNKLITAVLYLMILLVLFSIQVQIKDNQGNLYLIQAILQLMLFLIILYGLNGIWIRIREILFCDEILEEYRRSIMKGILVLAMLGTIGSIVKIIFYNLPSFGSSVIIIWRVISIAMSFFVITLYYHPYLSVMKYRFWIVFLTTVLIGYSQANMGAPYLVCYFLSVGGLLLLVELQSENKIASSIVLHILVWMLMIVGSVVFYYLLRDKSLSVFIERIFEDGEGITALRTIVSEANWYEFINNPGTARDSRNYLANSGNFIARLLFTSGWFATVLYLLLFVMLIGVMFCMFCRLRKESITYYLAVGMGIYIIVSVIGGILYSFGISPIRITFPFVYSLKSVANVLIWFIPIVEFWTQGYRKSIFSKRNVSDKKLASFLKGYTAIFLFLGMLFLVTTGKDYNRVFDPSYNVEKVIELNYDAKEENVIQIGVQDEKSKVYDEISLEDLQNGYSNLILVSKDKRYGYIDAFSGEEIIGLQYEEAYSFSKYGMAPVLTDQDEKTWSWINENGIEIFSYSNVEEVIAINEDQYILKIGDVYGILEYSGELNMLEGGTIDNLTISPDKKYLYSTDEESTKVWYQEDHSDIKYYEDDSIDCSILKMRGELFTFYDDKENVTIARLLDNGEYQVLSSGEYTDVMLDEDTGHEDCYYAAMDDKYGILGYDEKLHVIYTILEMEYQEVPVALDENLIIVKQKNKYGCISFQNQQILEIKYDSEDAVLEQLKKDHKLEEEIVQEDDITVRQYIV